VVAAFVHSLAAVTTILRLYERHRKRQIWWDDYCVVIALLADIVYAFSISLGLSHDGECGFITSYADVPTIVQDIGPSQECWFQIYLIPLPCGE